ncbi:MAG: hypothetical protein L7S44_02135 [Flavobacteriaceae bacterium]|nr:hypothetical protein [Flavobacteriaceae bacterium]
MYEKVETVVVSRRHPVTKEIRQELGYKIGNTMHYIRNYKSRTKNCGSKIKILDLSNKGIENDPDRPGNFIYKSKSYSLIPFGHNSCLETICFTGNKLTKVPGDIRFFNNLKKLALGYNKLSKLPIWIGKLNNLESLIVTKNELTSLPASIGKLTKLKELGLSGNKIESLPITFKKLRPDIKIYYKRKTYTRDEFMEMFKIVKTRVSSNTDIFNNEFYKTNKISNVNRNRLAYLKKNKKPNGTLRRLYSLNSLNSYMSNRNEGILHGNSFSSNNIRKLGKKTIVNKNVHLRNIKSRLMNTSVNNFNRTVNRIKNNLPPKVSKTDVNNIVRSLNKSSLKNNKNSSRNKKPLLN